jgi:hypothetical protein
VSPDRYFLPISNDNIRITQDAKYVLKPGSKCGF